MDNNRLSLRDRVNKFRWPSAGQIATAAFLVCTLSGIVIAIPYDVTNAYLSVSLIASNNVWSALSRNLHYWSAQAFFIFTLIHLFNHLKKKHAQKAKSFQMASPCCQCTFSILGYALRLYP